jgi:hypothetical protein
MWLLLKWAFIFGVLIGLKDTQQDIVEGLRRNKARHDLNRRPV